MTKMMRKRQIQELPNCMHYDVEESVEDMAYPERIDKDIFAMKKDSPLIGRHVDVHAICDPN